MQWIRTVAGRLGLTFGVVALAMAAVIGAAVLALGHAGTELETLATSRLAALTQLARLEAKSNAVAVVVRDLGLNEDVGVQDQLLKELKGLDSEITESLGELERLGATAKSAEATEMLTGIRQGLGAVNAVRKKVMMAIEEARYDDIKPLLSAEFRPRQAELSSLLRSTSDRLAESTRSEAASTTAQLARTEWLLVLAVAVVFALAALAMAWVIRGLMRQLGGEPDAAAETARLLAAGDLTVRFEVRPGDTRSLTAALASMQANLAGIVSRVRDSAQSVAAASEQIARGNGDMSTRTEHQASALQQTAASMEQLASTVRQNADSAQGADTLAREAAGLATRGGEVVGEVVSTMRGINESARRIADITAVIDGIAFQTNILALNAAVEAARAGDQGRGFAVVAGEVRTLARRSADAAREIKDLIAASVERVDAGTALVDRAGSTMGQVVESVRRVSGLVGEISGASSQQSEGVQQVGSAIQAMDQATQQNAALVEESAAAADSMKQQAEQLVVAVSAFKLASA